MTSMSSSRIFSISPNFLFACKRVKVIGIAISFGSVCRDVGDVNVE